MRNESEMQSFSDKGARKSVYITFFAGLHPEEAICGSDVRRISGGPEDGGEAVPRPPIDQPSLAPLPQGE